MKKETKKAILNRIIKGYEFKEEYDDSKSEIDNFPLMEHFDGDSSYAKDYEKAVAFANKKKGLREVYTKVDGEKNKIFYLKGLHYVNRFGFCVLGYG